MPHRSFVPPPAAVTAAAALVLYALFWPTIARNDAAPGAVRALPHAAKLLALGGTAVLAVATARLLRTLAVPHAARWGALVTVLPTTMLDAALIGPAGVLCAAACVAALDAAIGQRPRAMLAYCGLALGLHFQALLFAPFVAAVLIRRRTPLRWWTVCPLVAIATLVPTWLPGWSAFDRALPFGDGGAFSALSLGAPDLWFVVQGVVPDAARSLPGLAIASAVGVTGWYIGRCGATMPSGARMLPVAILAVLVTAGLLPYLRGSDFFLADVCAFAWAAARGSRGVWITAGMIQGGSMLALAGAAFGVPALVVAGFAAMACATYRVAVTLWPSAANDNPLMVRTV